MDGGSTRGIKSEPGGRNGMKPELSVLCAF